MPTEAAATIWQNMNPAERYEIMQRVGYMKSQTKWFRACIALIQKGG